MKNRLLKDVLEILELSFSNIPEIAEKTMNEWKNEGYGEVVRSAIIFELLLENSDSKNRAIASLKAGIDVIEEMTTDDYELYGWEIENE